MMDINETINKTMTIAELDSLRTKVNEMFDTRKRVLNLVSEAHELGNKSFGYIKESFENLSTKLYKTADGKDVMKRYAKAIKENKSLSSLHKLYENIRKANSKMDLDYFVGSLCETNWNVSKPELKKGLESLSKIVAEGYIIVGEGADKYLGSVNDKLDGALEFIAENRVGQKNLVKYSEAVKVIRETVEKNGNISDSFNEMPELDSVVDALVKKYSKNQEDKEDGKEQLANSLLRGDEENVFEKRKNGCLSGLDEAIKRYEESGDKEEVDTLRKVYEQVSAKKYDPNTIGADITNFAEMTRLFE